MAKNTNPFQTIRTEGAILPADILQRIAALSVEGVSPEAYHLPPNTKLNEAISRAWTTLLAHWKAFRETRQTIPETETGTAVTNERWLLPLFKELDYGRLTTAKSPEIDGRVYPIERFYNHVPIHLIGCNLSLDRRTRGARGAATASPHSMIQEFLNRSDKSLWGFLSNGLQLRILRDNISLSRQAYVEFDLEAMFDGEVYSDFALLWMLCHQSRVEAENPEQCWLERWSRLAREEGTRVLKDLRVGVAKAIEALGRGFLDHPRNDHLRQKLRTGALSKNDFYRQLLRIVYRLLFLFVAEDRQLLHPPKADRKAGAGSSETASRNGLTPEEVYDRFYSTRRLRELAHSMRGSKHADLWHGLSLVFSKLEKHGCPELGLPALGSFLWRADSTPDLLGPYQASGESRVASGKEASSESQVEEASSGSRAASGEGTDRSSDHSPLTTRHSLLSNDHLLQAIRELAYVEQDRVLRSVDYRNLGSEELGSVYEALLELHPVMNVEARSFELLTAAGNERKITGSYYTPDSLVQCLLDSALDPMVEQRLAEARRMANGEWRVASGDWRVVTGKKGGASDDAAVAAAKAELMRVFYDALTGGTEYGNRIVSRLGSLEAGDGDRKAGVSTDEGISERRDVRDDQSTAPGSGVDPVESGRGLGARGEQGVSAIHSSGSRQSEGTRNPTDSEPGSGADDTGQGRADSGADRDPRQAARRLIEKPELLEQLFHQLPLATRYLLLAEQALLALKVCDPACGSGHFLIAAAHRLARHLARIRTDDAEPGPEDYQHALRDVIGRCIYGVDINPMAVELCKVSLWMEALEPGKPLSFLDHHIQCGNSLLGATPALLRDGIPDDAFKPITGDVKAVCSELKRRNKRERREYQQGQGYLFEPFVKLGNLPAAIARINAAADDSLEDIAAKQQMYERLVAGADYLNARLLCDLWCAVFVWQKDDSDLGRLCPTERDFRNVENNPHSILPHVKEEIRRLARQYQFFHWHLAFPDVFNLASSESRVASGEETDRNANHSPLTTRHSPLTSSGFDVILSNPPWERVKLQEKEWFAQRHEEIAKAPNAAARKRLIKKLPETDPDLYREFCEALRQAEGISHLLRDSGAYPLCGRGDVNVYTVFAELFRNRLAAEGRFGAVLPSGIATDDTTKFYFQDVIQTRSLVSFYDFENKNIFPEVHSSYKFCLMTAGSGQVPLAEAAEFAFFCHAVDDLRQPGKRFTLSPEDIELLNPNTRTCPIFRSTADAELTKWIHIAVSTFTETGIDEPNLNVGWPTNLFTMLHSSGAAHLFVTPENCNEHQSYAPLYEGKMFHQFNHRYASVILTPNLSRPAQPVEAMTAQLGDPNWKPSSRASVPIEDIPTHCPDGTNTNWFLGFKDVTSSTNERTLLATVMPTSGITDSVNLFAWPSQFDGTLATCLLASLNSFVLDFVVRQKIGGVHIKFYVIRQLPIPSPTRFLADLPWESESLRSFILPRVLELTYTAWDLEAFALDCGYAGPPFRWDEERRFLLRCELDALFFHLYLGPPEEWGREASSESRVASGEGTDRDSDHSPLTTDHSPLTEAFPTPRHAVDYIMETFPIVKRKDIARTEVKNEDGEVVQEGTYITKETILQIYDEMQHAIDTGHPYQSRLDPPPGPPEQWRVGEGRMVNGEWRMGEDGDAESTDDSPATTFYKAPPYDPAHWPPHIHPPKEEQDS